MKYSKWILGLGLFLGLAVIFYFGALLIYGNCPDLITNFDNAGIILGYLIGIFSLTIGVLKFKAIYAFFTKFASMFKRKKFESTGEPFDIPKEKFTATIIPVSNPGQPGYILKFINPRYVSFIYTERDKSIGTVKALSNEFQDIAFFPTFDELENKVGILLDANDVKKCRDLANRYINYYLEKGIPRDEIFIDTTGGTVPMSIGCFQAAEENNISTFYIIGKDKEGKCNTDDINSGYTIFMSDHSHDNQLNE